MSQRGRYSKIPSNEDDDDPTRAPNTVGTRREVWQALDGVSTFLILLLIIIGAAIIGPAAQSSAQEISQLVHRADTALKRIEPLFAAFDPETIGKLTSALPSIVKRVEGLFDKVEGVLSPDVKAVAGELSDIARDFKNVTSSEEGQRLKQRLLDAIFGHKPTRTA